MLARKPGSRRSEYTPKSATKTTPDPQLYLMTQNEISIGRGGDGMSVNLALYTNDEVSREHLRLRRDAGAGRFLIVDQSMNGTWLNGRRLARGVEESLPAQRANQCCGSNHFAFRGQTMKVPYLAHIPFVLLFLLFVVGFVLTKGMARRN